MIRLNRLAGQLNSLESQGFILASRRRSPVTRYFSGGSSLLLNHTINTTHLQLSTSPIFGSDRRKFEKPTKKMESDGIFLPEITSSVPEGFIVDQTINPSEISVDEVDRDSSSSISQNPNHGIENFSEMIGSDDISRSHIVSSNSESEGIYDSLEAEREKVDPEEILKDVMHLECESSAEGGFCSVHLVGTAHVSKESCKKVQAVISYLKPQVVFLELCPSRVAILTPQNLQVPTVREMVDMWKKRKMNVFGILYSYFLAKVANKLEVIPGSEFRVAFEEAMKYKGKVILGDRPVQITLRRTWGKMTLWHKTKFIYSLLFQTIFLPNPEDLNKMLKEMDDVDMLTLVIQEMSRVFPTLMETLVHERDLYMSSTLLKVASEHTSVVAVVGKGHLQGIKKQWKQPVEIKDLLEVPTKNPVISSRKILTSLGIAITGAAIVSGIYIVRRE